MSVFHVHLLFMIALLNPACSKDITLYFNQRACFQTVTHFHSNPAVTGKSLLYYTYKNDRFKNITIDISCPKSEKYFVIHLDLLKLSLPKREVEFCLDSELTDYNTCTESAQCNCCEYPNGICAEDIEIDDHNKQKCDGKSQCAVNVTSKYLKNCDMEHYQSHSRWAEVFFTCKIYTDKDNKDIPESTWMWGILPCIVFIIALVIIYVCCRWKKKLKRDNFQNTDVEAHELLTQPGLGNKSSNTPSSRSRENNTTRKRRDEPNSSKDTHIQSKTSPARFEDIKGTKDPASQNNNSLREN